VSLLAIRSPSTKSFLSSNSHGKLICLHMNGIELSISELLEVFPRYRVALVVARGLAIPDQSPTPIANYVEETEARIAQERGDRPVSEIAEVAAWRQAYKGFGIRKTSYRPSVERLFRHVQRHGVLPRINALVDLYNAVSLAFRMPAGADDLDKLAPPLAFRFSRPDDSFISLGDAERRDDPPKSGEVVYADQGHVLCRRWNWYQDDRSATSLATRNAVITVQSFADAGEHDVEAATETLALLLSEHLEATVDWAVADGDNPVISAGG